MLSVDEARKKVLGACWQMEAEGLPLAKALGRVLAAPAKAQSEHPRFDVSAMDGFAVRHAELLARSLHLEKALKAGDRPRVLPPSSAIPIMTGAPVPKGADTVLPKEKALAIEGRVTASVLVEPGANIRRQGEEFRKGKALLPAGTRLSPRHLGLLASAGLARVEVRRKPRVALIISGSELGRAGEKLAPGKIHDANGPMLQACLEEAGFKPAFYALVKDEPEKIRKALAKAMESCEVVLLSGGVSVGDYDWSRPLLKEIGLRQLFWGVAQKPGYPLYVGTGHRPQARLAFGLPGNPASAFVCFREYVLPALSRMQGLKAAAQPARARLAHDLRPRKRRTHFLKASFSFSPRGPEVKTLGGQGSHMLGSLAEGNALLVARPGKPLKRGNWVEVDLL